MCNSEERLYIFRNLLFINVCNLYFILCNIHYIFSIINSLSNKNDFIIYVQNILLNLYSLIIFILLKFNIKLKNFKN